MLFMNNFKTHIFNSNDVVVLSSRGTNLGTSVPFHTVQEPCEGSWRTGRGRRRWADWRGAARAVGWRRCPRVPGRPTRTSPWPAPPGRPAGPPSPRTAASAAGHKERRARYQWLTTNCHGCADLFLFKIINSIVSLLIYHSASTLIYSVSYQAIYSLVLSNISKSLYPIYFEADFLGAHFKEMNAGTANLYSSLSLELLKPIPHV